MSIFNAVEFDQHEEVVFINEPENGLRAIIAIHNTVLGPALGGCRMWDYTDESEAIRDVLRLSRGMTYKSAILDCGLGGGKSVIIGNPYTEKTPQLLHAMGRWIETLGERYITGEDIGTNPDDMREIRSETRCVSCLREEDGGYGDPAAMTALGVLSAMRAGMKVVFGSDDFGGLRVAVQGIGNVGINLCRLLHEEGALLTVADVKTENLKVVAEDFNANVVEPDEIYEVDSQVFAPCAFGAVLNDSTIPKLKAQIVAGAANNQLDEERHGQMLADREIVYVPDFVANGGGLVSCAAEWYHTERAQVPRQVRKIFDTSLSILERAEAEGITTADAADSIAVERVAKGNTQ